MSIRLTTTRAKLIASGALVAAAAGAAGLGTFGSFVSSTSASESVSSGTVSIALGASGAANRLSVAATNIVPGDTIQRAVTLTNGGTSNLSSITLSTSATTSSLLDTDTTNGLQLKIDSCSNAWTEGGTASTGYTYACPAGSTVTSVLASRPVIGSNLSLTGLAALTSMTTDNLVVTLSFPTAADNTFQNKTSVINFAFTGTQRTATNR
jgi:spore coat-associated protein N